MSAVPRLDATCREFIVRMSRGRAQCGRVRSGPVITRRSLIGGLCAAAIAVSAPAGLARAAERFPTQPVRVLVPFGAGSLSDIFARIVADGLSARWGQPVQIDNRPGVAGTAAAAKAEPDGHTLMITSNGHTVIGLTNKNLPFDPLKDFVGVTRIASLPMSLIVGPEVPARSYQELIELAKARPGALNYTSPGVASTAYLAAALFRKAADIDIVHVPYKSAPEALTAVLRGDVQMYFAAVNLTTELVHAGKVRALASATEIRIPQLPQVPTFKEVGLSFVYDSWFGVMAPAGARRELVEQIRIDVIEVLRSLEIRARFDKQAAVIVYDPPGRFDAIIREDTARMAQAIEAR